MSDSNIYTMNDKQLRNEVQLLRDELAIMKRKYEDIIYNLDTNNFSSRFVKEHGNMKTAIEVTAEGIKTKVSKEDLDGALTQYSTISQTATDIQFAVTEINKELEKYSTISQTATDIELAVIGINNSTDEKLKGYSTIKMTSEAITSTVTKEYVLGKTSDVYATNENVRSMIDNAETDIYATMRSEFEVTANGILAEVSSEYETKENANIERGSLWQSVSSVSVTANGVSSKVSKLEQGKYGENGEYTLFTQSADKFYFDGNQTVFTGAIWLTDNNKQNSFSISHDESQNAQRVIYLHNPKDPLVIGRNQTSVYIGSANTSDTLVATRGWVLENVGSGGTDTAVFG